MTICSYYKHNISPVSTLCDVMVLSRFYSENGTNLEANEIHLMKSELLAKKREQIPTVQREFWKHNAGCHRNLAVNRLAPGIK